MRALSVVRGAAARCALAAAILSLVFCAFCAPPPKPAPALAAELLAASGPATP